MRTYLRSYINLSRALAIQPCSSPLSRALSRPLVLSPYSLLVGTLDSQHVMMSP